MKLSPRALWATALAALWLAPAAFAAPPNARPAIKSDLKLTATRVEPPAVPEEPNFGDQPGGLLESVESQNAVMSQIIKAEVENAVKAARHRLASDPQKVKDEMKMMLDRVSRAPELNSQLRAQLRDQVSTAIREADRQAIVKDDRDLASEQALAAAKEQIRTLDALQSERDRIKQLMDRFDSLMNEGRYREAEDSAAAEVNKILPDSPIASSATLNSQQTRYYEQQYAVRIARDKGVMDCLYQSELHAIPFPDDQPIVYPDASIWEELTLRRKKYASVDLKKQGGAEEKIRKALEETTSLEFVETPLQDVVDYLKDYHSIEIQLDTKALDEASVGTDTPVTKNLKGITLRSALRLMLGGMDLTYVVKNEVLMITTVDKANSDLVTKVYPVADLVLPIRQMGGMGGMSGMGGMGGMGGGMGGMGGGMGGMGGGMGGMGGGGMGGGGFGGGGMGGGGGGGFFSVPK